MPIPVSIDPSGQTRLWKRGLSLEEAWWRFGLPQQRQRYNSVQPAEVTKPVDKESLSALGGVEIYKAATALISDAFRPILDQSRIANEMRSQLVELLRNGRLVGYGYHFPRQALDRPVRIPDDLFDIAFVRWDKSELEGNGSKYFAVKIFRSSWLKELPVPVTRSAPTKQKVGRQPSTEIIEIIHDLSQNPNFEKMQRKAQAELVIEAAITKHPKRFSNRKGLHFSTVCRYLHQVLDSDNT